MHVKETVHATQLTPFWARLVNNKKETRTDTKEVLVHSIKVNRKVKNVKLALAGGVAASKVMPGIDHETSSVARTNTPPKNKQCKHAVGILPA